METGVVNANGAGKSSPSSGAGSESRLAIDLIGEVAVRRDGETLPLPQSKKCRALIAYLAVTARPHRREALCELLWEVPDDPKGALRWSLSKIRRVLGDALIADRDSVAIDAGLLSVGVTELCQAAGGLDSRSTEELERLASWHEPAFGQDLDLPRCPEFQGWLIAVREDVRRAQLALLGELASRLSAEPERALPFARRRIALDPLDEQARLDLLAVLIAAGRSDEAERQRLLAVEVLKEAGIPVPAGLAGALRNAQPEAERARPSFQRIQFCTSADGTRIAYSAVGSGPPLVKTANWMGHLEFEWESPILRHWLVELSRNRTLVRYDARGNGLSDRRPADLSLDAFVEDLEAVTGTLAEESFDLIGISQGAPVAIAYAARHPERVRKLVLFGGFATGWCHSPKAEVKAQWNAMITLTEVGWGTDNPAFRQMFTSLFLPRATREQQGWFNELQRVSATPSEAQRLQRAIGEFDASGLLDQVRAPTLIFHSRDDAIVGFGAGRHLAKNIKGAEFVGLDSENHLPLEDEAAWTAFVEQLRDFLAR